MKKQYITNITSLNKFITVQFSFQHSYWSFLAQLLFMITIVLQCIICNHFWNTWNFIYISYLQTICKLVYIMYYLNCHSFTLFTNIPTNSACVPKSNRLGRQIHRPAEIGEKSRPGPPNQIRFILELKYGYSFVSESYSFS